MAKKLRWAKHQKRWFGKWHLYLGIFAGVIVAFVGLTGSILTFGDEIDEALNPELFSVPVQKYRPSVPQLINLVHQKHPGLKYSYVTIPEAGKPSATYVFFDRATEQQIFVNPYDASICGKRNHDSSFIGIVTEIHISLFIPVVGQYFVGLCTLILLILTITGLRLWIPKKWKQLRSMLTVKFSGSFTRQNNDWHNVLGFYSAPVVIVLSLTGFLISFSILFIPMLFLMNGQSPQGVASLLNAQSAKQHNAVPISLERVMQIAARQMPGAEVRGIASPANKQGSYRLDLLKEGFPVSGRRQMLTLDQYTGKVLLHSDKDFPEGGLAYLSWLTPLHYGSFGGTVTKVIALIASLVPMALCITGFIIWVPRWRKQRRKESKKAVGAKPDEVPSEVVIPMATGAYLLYHIKKGLIYGFWMLLIAGISGLLYGLAAGILIQPLIFVIVFSTLLIIVNFFISAMLMLLNTLLLMPFKKSFSNITRYFRWSFGFFRLLSYLYFDKL